MRDKCEGVRDADSLFPRVVCRTLQLLLCSVVSPPQLAPPVPAPSTALPF